MPALLWAHQKWSQYQGTTEAERKGWLRRILTNYLIEVARQHDADGRDVARERTLEICLRESSARVLADTDRARFVHAPSTAWPV